MCTKTARKFIQCALLTRKTKRDTIQSERTRKEVKKMKTKKHDKTRGWYTYEDGFEHWVFGMSAAEKRNEIRKHGKIVRFINTD